MSTESNSYDRDLGTNAANYVPLSPLSFLTRAAAVYPDRTAVIHGTRRYGWGETAARCQRLANSHASDVSA